LHQVTLEGLATTAVVTSTRTASTPACVEAAEQPKLIDAFDHPRLRRNWILTEDQQGLVILDRCPTPQAAREAFTEFLTWMAQIAKKG
jgi:hypothetical protein